MEFPLTLLDLAGAVALLLWAVHMVQTGIQRAFGAQLRRVLGRALRTRLAAFAAGLGITAVLQSSTATGLMVTGFAAGGLVELVPALAAMLGANVGTTLIVQLFSFQVSFFAPALILLGVLLFRRTTAGPRDFGRVLIGLGLMLMALRQLLDLVTPFEDVPSLRMLLGSVATEPLLALVVAAGLTWAAHSSVAVVLLVMALAEKGVVPPQAAFALVLGANLGTAINPVLEGAAGTDPAARRLPLGNLLIRVAGAGLFLSILAPVGRLLVQWEPNEARAAADFHTLFNVVLAAVFLPMLPACAALLRRLVPARVDPTDPSSPLYLDPAARETPSVALGGAAREALRMVDVLDAMLSGLRSAFERSDIRRVAETKRLDDVLDGLNAAITSYLVSLDPDSMIGADHRRAAQVLAFATNLAHAGDTVERNLLGLVGKTIKRGLAFSKPEQAQLIARIDRLIDNLRVAGSLFVTQDMRVARQLAREKEMFRRLESEAIATHFESARDGQNAGGEASGLYFEALRDLKRVNAHLVAAAAYPVLDNAGELLPSRLRPGKAYDDE